MSIHRCAPPTNTDRDVGRPARGFLSRLKRAEAGNVLPMMAMALVPIAGMVGSGLDMSRAYMAKAKLQNACDSAALAARREMGGHQFSYDADGDGQSDASEEGERFFDFNFPDGTMGITGVTPTIQAGGTDASVVVVNATAEVPTTVMRMFGSDSIAISVSCDADKDYVHSDVMLVLDVTGSMNCQLGGGSGCSNTQGAQAGSRIQALWTAAGALYDALDHDVPNIRTRYGFMPYSATTNVGRDLAAGHVYHPAFYHHNGATTATVSNRNAAWLTSTWKAAVADSPLASTATSGTAHPGWGFWGCVEERWSYAASAATGTNISNIVINTTVTDEDINYVPTTTTTRDNRLRWPVYDHEKTNSGDNKMVCPAPAAKLAVYASRTAFDAKLKATTRWRGGATHHDVGMVWGARYLSSNGMFQASNPTSVSVNSVPIPVEKHIVFMSDGNLQVTNDYYSAIGWPTKRDRTTNAPGTTGQSNTQQAEARFQSACDRAQALGMTVWVIALDIGVATSALSNCATSADHYYEANTADELENAFDLIGKGIGKLRLTN